MKKLAVAVTFFYRKDKISFLSQTLSNLHVFAKNAQVYVFTNTSNKIEQQDIRKCFHRHSNVKYKLLVPKLLGHPFFLAWSHKDIFRQLVRSDSTITHYLYLEDDILLTRKNIEYYLEGESRLCETNFLPSFIRYELDGNGTMYALDIKRPSTFHTMTRLQCPDNYYYADFPYLYQGVYLINAKYMKEYFDDNADSPDYLNFFQTRERSTAVLFHKIPEGFKSRNLVGCIYRGDKVEVDARCLIHHLPDSYVNDAEKCAALRKIEDIVT